ncbi:PaaI family thioesterase [Frigidibacter sp. ROC022]|uniref:PaaI family thioesterase n=1 Tax=Frigidibacter sp. ROC022 TaxID=2971796 RepID=UPI00215A1F8F|nr:PaaI family thioesterase [Frigidibacter sp. ROC022]MCR8723014.1 PaaI family thioesterase [Frigidibacter sp. ROC022]
MTDAYAAASPEDLLSPQELLSMSGLEFLTAMKEGRLAGPPIAGLMNYRPSVVEAGRVVFSGAPAFEVMNPIGTVHGGWYGTLLDSCMACAVQTLLPRGTVYTTLEYKINIIRPVPLGMQVDAIGTASHVGRTTGVASGEIRGQEDGKLYATGSTTCLIMTP